MSPPTTCPNRSMVANVVVYARHDTINTCTYKVFSSKMHMLHVLMPGATVQGVNTPLSTQQTIRRCTVGNCRQITQTSCFNWRYNNCNYASHLRPTCMPRIYSPAVEMIQNNSGATTQALAVPNFHNSGACGSKMEVSSFVYELCTQQNHIW